MAEWEVRTLSSLRKSSNIGRKQTQKTQLLRGVHVNRYYVLIVKIHELFWFKWCPYCKLNHNKCPSSLFSCLSRFLTIFHFAHHPSLPPCCCCCKTESGTEEFPCQFQGFLDWQRGGRCRFRNTPPLIFQGPCWFLGPNSLQAISHQLCGYGWIFRNGGGKWAKISKNSLEKMFAGEHTYFEYPDFRVDYPLSTALHKHRCPTKTLEINHKTQPENRMICVS